MADIAHRQPRPVAQHGGLVLRLADVVHEQHGAAYIDQAVLHASRLLARAIVQTWAGGRRDGANLDVHIAERVAHSAGRCAVSRLLGIHPGDKAQFRGAIELDDAGARKQGLQGRGVVAHPTRAADADQLDLWNRRQLAVFGPLQQQQQLAGHSEQTGCVAAGQRTQAARRRKFLLHDGTCAIPKPLQGAKQKQ